MEEPTLKRVPYPDHPDRCQANQKTRDGSSQQCIFLNSGRSLYCVQHEGTANHDPALKELNLYRIKKYQARIGQLKAANAARTIDEELAILRMILEEVLQKCELEGEMGLMLYSTKITEMVREIKGCVLTSDKLATKAGQLIGRSEAVVIAGKVVTILSNEIDDQLLLGRLADKILDAFTSSMPEDETS